jgi:hypothetical protein
MNGLVDLSFNHLFVHNVKLKINRKEKGKRKEKEKQNSAQLPPWPSSAGPAVPPLPPLPPPRSAHRARASPWARTLLGPAPSLARAAAHPSFPRARAPSSQPRHFFLAGLRAPRRPSQRRAASPARPAAAAAQRGQRALCARAQREERPAPPPLQPGPRVSSLRAVLLPNQNACANFQRRKPPARSFLR